jgi:P4 family phage/plasmid primase-like protien
MDASGAAAAGGGGGSGRAWGPKTRQRAATWDQRDHWSESSERAPCPVCGCQQPRCSVANDGEVVLCTGRVDGLAGWARVPADLPGPANWAALSTCFVRVHEDEDRSARDEHGPERGAQQRTDAQRRIDAARKLWDSCHPDNGEGEDHEMIVGTRPDCPEGRGAGHPRIVAYLEARGLPVDVLTQPLGRLRYHGEMPVGMNVSEGDEPKWVKFRCPTMVARADLGWPGQLQGVHRTLLDHTGKPAKRERHPDVPVEMWRGKMALGPINSGAAIRLADVAADGVLALTEGIETALAVHACTGWGVWSCISTSGLRNVLLPAPFLDEKRVQRVVICADADRGKAGSKEVPPGLAAARACRLRLIERYPELRVDIALPGPELVPALYDKHRRPLLKGLDWLDVLNHLREIGEKNPVELVAAALLHARADPEGVAVDEYDQRERRVVQTSAGWDNRELVAEASLIGGEGRRLPEAGEVGIMRHVLLDVPELRPEPGAAAGSRWHVARNKQDWYVWDDGHGQRATRWRKLADEEMAALVLQRLQSYQHFKRGQWQPLNPGKKTLDNVLVHMRAQTQVGVTDMPAWIGCSFDRDGRPMWDVSGGLLRQDEQRGPIDPHEVICTMDGLMDAAAWRNGTLRLEPHTPRWFSTTCMPVSLPVARLRAAMANGAAAVHALAREMAPRWHQFISEVLPDAQDHNLAQMFAGYTLTTDMQYEVCLVPVGPSGSGKSTFMDGLREMIGRDAVVSLKLSDLQVEAQVATLRGATLAIFPDEFVGKFDDPGAIMGALARLIGRDQMSANPKYKDPIRFMAQCKVVVGFNEMPRFPDSAGKLKRRFAILPFPPAVDETRRKRDLKDVWREERSGIFLWSLIGLRELHKAGGFVMSARGREISEEMAENNAPVLRFVAEACAVGEKMAASVEAGELYRAWKKWAEREGVLPGPHGQFTQRLMAAAPGVVHERPAARAGEVRARYYKGIRLVDESLLDDADRPAHLQY